MIGIFLIGVLVSSIFSGNSSEPTEETLLVGHQMERQAMVSTPGLEVSSEVQDSALAEGTQETASE